MGIQEAPRLAAGGDCVLSITLELRRLQMCACDKSDDMQALISSVKELRYLEKPLPLSIYSSLSEQHILNAPINRPTVIFVLIGVKQIGHHEVIECPFGSFVFLPNSSTVDMRNIPGEEYLAILIEFDYVDFEQFDVTEKPRQKYVKGEIDTVLVRTLQQFVECSKWAPSELWSYRRRELLQLLYMSGYSEVGGLVTYPSFSYQLHSTISRDVAAVWGVKKLAHRLSVSESTLQRRIKLEGTSVRAVVERARLSHGLHMIQTSVEPVGRIAECCGYQSQSKFTEKFKNLFGVTPSALRKTRAPR